MQERFKGLAGAQCTSGSAAYPVTATSCQYGFIHELFTRLALNFVNDLKYDDLENNIRIPCNKMNISISVIKTKVISDDLEADANKIVGDWSTKCSSCNNCSDSANTLIDTGAQHLRDAFESCKTRPEAIAKLHNSVSCGVEMVNILMEWISTGDIGRAVCYVVTLKILAGLDCP